MAVSLKLRRGTTSQHSSFTGAEGEVTVDTTKDTLVVHDGSTAGGVPLAKESALSSYATDSSVVKLTGNQTIGGTKTFSSTISGSITGNAETVTNGVYTTGDQTIGGTKTFSNTITGSVSGNAGTVTNGVYTTGNQTIGGTKTFSSTITGSVSGNAGTVTNGVYTTGDQTVGGTKTLSSNPVFSAGTANGVLYLDGSKVATSGSAITFNGTNLAVSGTIQGTQIRGGYNDTTGTINTVAQDLGTNTASMVLISASTTLTTTVPPAGSRASVIIKTSGSVSRTVTFGTGFKSQGTLATGNTADRFWVVNFVSDGTVLYETGRTTTAYA